MNDRDIQWHPAFVSAMELELKKNRNELMFQREYNLNTKPLQIDLLVIKKKAGVELSNEIGKIFRGHNIIEYKSPDDSLNIDTFYKTQGYACFYKAGESAIGEREANDITVSIIRDTKPIKLLKDLKDMNVQITKPYDGIYYINNNVLFKMQIIVTKELSAKGHTWIKSLSDKMQMPDMKKLLNETSKLKTDYERELADSILEVALKVNSTLVERLRGDESMSGALLELVEPLILEREKSAEIKGAINALRNFGHSDEEIKEAIMKSYNLSEKDTEQYL